MKHWWRGPGRSASRLYAPSVLGGRKHETGALGRQRNAPGLGGGVDETGGVPLSTPRRRWFRPTARGPKSHDTDVVGRQRDGSSTSSIYTTLCES